MGTYKTLTDKYQARNPGTIPFAYRAVFGLFSGALGGFVGTPADLALVRMQSDATLPVE
jgi:solute carrier family 25 oxoglutarate transporter 11